MAQTKPFAKYRKRLLRPLIIVLLSLLSLALTFELAFINKIYPGIYVGNANISSLTPKEAEEKIIANLDTLSQKELEFTYPDATKKLQKIKISLKSMVDTNKIPDTVRTAFSIGRSKFYLPPQKLDLAIEFNQKFDSLLKDIAAQTDTRYINATLELENGQIRVNPSKKGQMLDKKALKEMLAIYLSTGALKSHTLPVKSTEPKLGSEEASEIKKNLEARNSPPVKVAYKNKSWELDVGTVLEAVNSIFSNSANVPHRLNLIESALNRPAQEPNLYIDPNSPAENPKITILEPPVEGYELDTKRTAELITESLITKNINPIDLPVKTIAPKNPAVSKFGIKELLGQGISNFKGSIENRIFNVKLTAGKINGILVPPNETFSFVNAVGDISQATGFKQAYIIKSGRTVLDDGGGVCQDSTTLFRAVLNAGLPIVERTAHAYRVGYYEQGFPPGLDATVFYPSVDFKFKNDTPAYILIQAYTVGTTLYIDLYGTADDRQVKISTPTISDKTPPPPEIRQDDPTLPRGTVKQVDWPAEGAKVNFKRTVVKMGETTIDETFTSNYRAWQAVYLVGTKDN